MQKEIKVNKKHIIAAVIALAIICFAVGFAIIAALCSK